MKNKNRPFSCSLWFQEQVLLLKTIKEQGFLRKSRQNTYPMDPGSEIRKKFIPDPDQGGKKAPYPGLRSATLRYPIAKQKLLLSEVQLRTGNFRNIVTKYSQAQSR
jgi:hypothetical protein